VGGYARRCLGVLDSLWLSESVRARVTVCVCVCVLLMPFEYVLKVEHTEVRACVCIEDCVDTQRFARTRVCMRVGCVDFISQLMLYALINFLKKWA
jgi:hypothetical protein